MIKDLMAAEWKDVLESLEKVPVSARNEAWVKTMDLIKEILESPNSLAVAIVPSELRYAPPCDLCHKAIALDEDYVFKAISCKFRHYDCHFRSSGSGMT